MKQCSDADHIVDSDMCSEGNKQDIKVKNNWEKKGEKRRSGRKERQREGRKGNRKEEKNNQEDRHSRFTLCGQ